MRFFLMMNSSYERNFFRSNDHLLSIIDKYNIKNIGPQVDELHILKEYVNTNKEMSLRDKLSLYQALFPPHGGLSDIYYWDNDVEKKKTRLTISYPLLTR